MAGLEAHKKDCLHWLGSDWEAVHLWLDEFFPIHGPKHRRFRHHREGIDQIRSMFGEEGAKAALIHILRDCRNIPQEKDYLTGVVDALGLPRHWPVAAYANYTEEAFATLVNYKLHGSLGIILWAFLGKDAADLLKLVAKVTDEELGELLRMWKQVEVKRAALSAFQPKTKQPQEVTDAVKEYFEEFKQSPTYADIVRQFGEVSYGYVPVEELLTPLVLVDSEYVEELRAELQGNDVLSLARFAVSATGQLPVKVATDPSSRSVTVVSTHRTLATGSIQVRSIAAGGIEIATLVTGAATMTIVSRVGDRLYVRSGVHRAYLMASMGLSQIPCLLIEENQFAAAGGLFPAFTPSVLAQTRPPLLMDYFDKELSLEVPLQRMNKVIRVSVEEFLVPVD